MNPFKEAAKNLLAAVLRTKLATEELRNARGKRGKRNKPRTRQSARREELQLDAASRAKIARALDGAPATRQLRRQQARLAEKGRSLLKPAG